MDGLDIILVVIGIIATFVMAGFGAGMTTLAVAISAYQIRRRR